MSNSLRPHGLLPARLLCSWYSPSKNAGVGVYSWILQARILEWVAISSSRASSPLRDQTQFSLIAGGYFTSCATSASSHIWMWELDYKESWVPKNWWFWTVVLEKTVESPLDCTEIQPVHSKGDQSWVFIGRTDAKTETPILWPPHAKS